MEGVEDEYNASKIVVLEGPLGIRKRPAMYIGSTGPSGVLHLLFEALDNAVDEAMAGHCKTIRIRLSQNGTGEIAELTDDGRGIPIDIMPKYNKPALEVIMTSLHSGGKFNNDVYKTAGGLHGVGLTVINSLSEFTEVTVKKNGKEYNMAFSKGAPTSSLKEVGETKDRGTTIRFKPDPEIFVTPHFDAEALKDRLRYTSFLNPGLRIIFRDERAAPAEENEFFSQHGISDFVTYLNGGIETITPVMHFKKQAEGITVEVAVQYNKEYDEKVESFVNNIRTSEGGTHVIGFRSAFSRAITNYITKSGALDKRETKVGGDDVREGLTAVINVLMPNPEFEGQTKEKLGNMVVKGIVENAVYSSLSRYLEEHPADARIISEKVINAAVAREASRKAREMVRKRSIFESSVLPGKLADCIEGDPEKAEIFIVEGESAGGSSKQGRNKNFQAILPLRGKILNVEKASVEKIFDNAEIHAMVAAFGAGIKETLNPDKVRYKKIIIMSDADVDGSHIRTLLLTFLYRYLKPVIERGYVYVAQPPLYKVTKGKELSYCYSDSELNAKLQQHDGKAAVQRYKGLGEMNPDQLWETTMDPENRMLKQIMITDAKKADELFTILMGIDVGKRRKFLEEHATEVTFLDI
ncbi:MAG: type IIA DNA topoisomerase subunit B [Candidatus Micrarchaeota archaeon]|nr:type IIA DNA topoisomerase subunit B [Candidatus Micrarchaeota archaeon]MDE1804346.1 type IIA DNA topoisomerase subunit B [Candidatus Micrarchaeota archaeon]MDE1846549.1 type IIA DNA topoisomerase subunit B [Candidatus Micrarchaeota archaeon]